MDSRFLRNEMLIGEEGLKKLAGASVVVFGVGDRGFERLEDDAGSALLREAQDVEGLVHGLTANQVGHQTALLSRKANAANDCSSFHLITP